MKLAIILCFAAFIASSSLAQSQNQPAQPQSPPQGWYQQAIGTSVQVSTIFFLNQYTGWAGTDSRLYKTTNGGDTWLSVTDYPVFNEQFVDLNNGWGEGDTSLLRSFDGGKSWLAVHAPIRGHLQIFGIDTLRLFVSEAFAGSDDGGKTWFTNDTSEALGHSQQGAMFFVSAKVGFLCGRQVLWFNPPPPVKGTKGGGIAYTIDGGRKWQAEFCSILADLWEVFAIDSLHVAIAGAGKTIAYSTDGGKSWNNAVNADKIYVQKFYFINNRLGYAVGFAGNIGFTSDSGKTWHAQNSTVTQDLYSVCFIDSVTGWASGDAGTIIHTIDGGKSWVRQYLPLPVEVRVNPEPFATKTTLSYSIPKAASVDVKLYDVLGKEVYHITSDGIQNEGAHSIEIQGDNLPGGTYYFILTAGSFNGMGKVTKIVP